MELKNLTIENVELKLYDEGRKFSGYASVFDGVDSYGDTIQKGAYEKTIQNRSRPIAMRWNHYGPVIGKWTTIQEDEKGLYVEGELTPGHSVAEDAYALLKHGAVTGMSIGFRINEYEKTEDGRLLKEIDLVEISIVESPADLAAQIEDVKFAIDTADSLKDIEKLLRDAGGFSRADSTALVARMKALVQGEPEPKNKSAEIADIIQQNTLINTLRSIQNVR